MKSRTFGDKETSESRRVDMEAASEFRTPTFSSVTSAELHSEATVPQDERTWDSTFQAVTKQLSWETRQND